MADTLSINTNWRDASNIARARIMSRCQGGDCY
jgi:hypothetical protein